jgi:hypothetical protein
MRRVHLVRGVVLAAALCTPPALAAERELDESPPPSSAKEIKTPIQRVFPREAERPPLVPALFPWVGRQLQKLPPFFADMHLDARYRTYYLRKDRTIDVLSEAWAMGGSLHFRSGWLAETFQVEAEGFTSQPIVAVDGRGGTLLLEREQEGYTVLGIANAKLRYKGVVLTGYRQYLDLPYVNRRDNRMTPNTFEGITLAKPEGDLRFSTGYTWKVKLRSSDQFRSFTNALGLEEDRGLAHAGVVWDPSENLHMGMTVGAVPDLLGAVYGELGLKRELPRGVQVRLDGQFTYRRDIGKDLLDDLLNETWNVGLRATTSYRGAVFRLGVTQTGPARIFAAFGTNPSYVDLMQRTFTRADETALLASASYDFAEVGIPGLTVIMNFVGGFRGKAFGVRTDSQEVDVTFDYKIQEGPLQSFWLRLRGSWLREDAFDRDGTDVRVILRYDFPVI